MDPDLIRRIVEAALLASPLPLSLAQIAALFPDDAPAPPGAIEQALSQLAEDNGRRGVVLVEVASGFRFQVDSALQPWVARLWAERPPRYSRALLETLALIAYRQPITRGEIEQIRGVAVSTHIVKTLEEREWIRVVGHRDVPGRPALFGTTRSFLDYFGLRALDQLPPLTELQDLPDLEPELPLEGIRHQAPERSAADLVDPSAVDTPEHDTGPSDTGAPAAQAADAGDSPPADSDADPAAGADADVDVEIDVEQAAARPAPGAPTLDAQAAGPPDLDTPDTAGAHAPSEDRDDDAADDTDLNDLQTGEPAGPEQNA